MSALPEITLSSVPETAPSAGEAKVHGSMSATEQLGISPVGVYVQHYLRRLKNPTSDQTDHLKAHADHIAAEAAKAINDISLDDQEDEEESEELLSLDPKEWKKQDHYAVLGLSRLRYKATMDDIIKAHRKKVLRHHPDKKAAQGHLNDDRFFKCIKKAFDILTDPEKRRQWDSVDPEISTDIPSAKKKGDFFEIYGPVFERESRFSKTQPVPMLGNADSSREEVESFYEFWYNIDSWRTFEYLDKDEVEGSNRDDKRYMETKNRKDRIARKNKDNQRLRTLVDNAIKADPRMQKFKEEDKKKRNARKNAREEEERKLRETKKAEEEAAKKAAEAAAAAEENEKKSRQDAHKLFKKKQRALKLLFKNSNYFAESDADVAAATAKLDKILAAKKDIDSLAAVHEQIEAAHAAGNASAVVDEIVSQL
ncbi:Zuotin [Coemansia brasiliensis]|uniref:Zuotin n=1 Tax=Coemansia brasiliensis TaxID=2650707 RepID=A0A9W8IK13_9FUNG|nr:Zuotin [Coemansia brasiliensis]